MANTTYPKPKEAGYVTSRGCTALDGGWIVVYERARRGPRELEEVVKAGHKQYAAGTMPPYVVIYRADPDDCRTWLPETLGKFVMCSTKRQALETMVKLVAGDDPNGILPVADGARLGGLNQRQFLFCQSVLSGMKPEEAYKVAGYKSKTPSDHAFKLAEKSDVKRYLEQGRTKQLKKFTMTKEDLLAYQQEILETPAGEVTADHRLCQEFRPGSEDEAPSIKMPSKDNASKLIVDVMAWNKTASDQSAAIGNLATAWQRVAGWTMPNMDSPKKA